MRLKSVKIANFRSYKKDAGIMELPDISILIGRNNAGKSNFIKALDWYRRMERGEKMSRRFLHSGNIESPLVLEVEFELDVAERESLLSHLTYRGGDISAEMKSSALLKELKHSLRFDPTGSLAEESVSITNYSGRWLAIWGCTRGNHPDQLNTVFWSYDIVGAANRLIKAGDLETFYPNGGSFEHRNRGFMWMQLPPLLATLDVLLRTYLQRILWVPPHRQAAAEINLGQDINVNPNGDNVLRVLNTIQSEDADLYDAIMLDIYDIIPDIKRIRTPPRGANVVGIINEPGDVQIGLDEAGTGFQQTLILVVNLLTKPQNSLLLVEEPEMNLNASAQRALFRLMKRLVKQRRHQLIITTHSTTFTETSENVATFLLDKNEGASSIRRLQEPAELRQLKQALGHENTDLFGYNAVLIVEGETEEKCVPALAALAGMDIVRLGIRIVNVGGAGNVTKIRALLEYLRDSDTVPYLMLDNHKPAAKEKENWVKQKLVMAENIFVLDNEFEDCFDDSTLALALEAVAREHGATITISSGDLARYRTSGKSVSHFLENKYHEATKHRLSKPELGTKIAEVLAQSSERTSLTEPEKVLAQIKARQSLRQ